MNPNINDFFPLERLLCQKCSYFTTGKYVYVCVWRGGAAIWGGVQTISFSLFFNGRRKGNITYIDRGSAALERKSYLNLI